MCGHPFVRALGDGSLPLSRFRRYMRQDYLFLIEYSRVLALASAKASDLESMGRFAALLSETLNSEMGLHRGFCADFGITEKQLEITRASGVTKAYTSFLLKTAESGRIEEICAALLPCQWSYDEIARSLAGGLAALPATSFHRRWIEGYVSKEYRSVTRWLVRFVDRVGGAAGTRTQGAMRRLFIESCRRELGFWESSWRPPGAPR